jgi:hypothetical protein
VAGATYLWEQFLSVLTSNKQEVEMNRKTTLSVALMMVAAAALYALSANVLQAIGATVSQTAVCGAGQYTAVLTGWDLNGATPKGEAAYNLNEDKLIVEVQNVKLKDGVVLDVLIGDDKVGKMQPLKNGSATATITLKDKLDEKSRVRVFDDDRPIVSANLKCDASQPDQN